MTNKEKIRDEIEKQMQLIWPKNTGEMRVVDVPKPSEQGWLNALKWMEGILDSLQEEPVSEELEEAASRYAKEEYNRKSPATLPDRCRGCYAPLMYAFKAGSKWKEEQLEKNRLAHCDTQTDEEAEIERDFVMGIIENEHRQPTFDDAIKYGMRLRQEQMMAKAKSGTVQNDNQAILDNGTYIDFDPSMQLKPSFLGLKEGDRIKVIVIKED